MALFKTRSAAIYGIDAHLIDVEVDLYSYGSPRDNRMVGMPDVAVRASQERINSALINSGFAYRRTRVAKVAEQRTQHANQRNNADQAPKDVA